MVVMVVMLQSVTVEEEESETDQILSIPARATDISELIANNVNRYSQNLGSLTATQQLMRNMQPQNMGAFAKIAEQQKAMNDLLNKNGVLDRLREQQEAYTKLMEKFKNNL